MPSEMNLSPISGCLLGVSFGMKYLISGRAFTWSASKYWTVKHMLISDCEDLYYRSIPIASDTRIERLNSSSIYPPCLLACALPLSQDAVLFLFISIRNLWQWPI